MERKFGRRKRGGRTATTSRSVLAVRLRLGCLGGARPRLKLGHELATLADSTGYKVRELTGQG